MVDTINTQVSALLVDDENKACANLRNLLIEYVDPHIQIIGIANSTREAEALIAEHKPDVVFLDIEMPHENAFQFLERIAPVPFEIIFVTAYDQYAVKAFRLNALDYILKPLGIKELKSAYEKVKSRIVYKSMLTGYLDNYSEVAEQVLNKARPQRITLKNSNGVEWIDFNDILFVEAQSSYSRIVYYKDNNVKEMVMSNPLSDYEELLPDSIFFRSHRSFLVNCGHIATIENAEANQNLTIANFVLPISRRRYSALIDFLRTNKYQNA